MSDNPVGLPEPAGESLPSQAMQEDDRRGFQPPSNTPLPNLKEERESQTARTLAITLVIMLGVSFLVQYASLWFLTVYNHRAAGLADSQDRFGSKDSAAPVKDTSKEITEMMKPDCILLTPSEQNRRSPR